MLKVVVCSQITTEWIAEFSVLNMPKIWGVVSGQCVRSTFSAHVRSTAPSAVAAGAAGWAPGVGAQAPGKRP